MNDKTLPPDIAKRVAQYVKMRDHIKSLDDAHKEQMKPFRETLERLSGALLGHLNEVGADSVATPAGTVYRTTKNAASIADMSAFWTYCVTQGCIEDMVDRKANVTAVAEYVEATGNPPPGVNFTSMNVVGVRRK